MWNYTRADNTEVTSLQAVTIIALHHPLGRKTHIHASFHVRMDESISKETTVDGLPPTAATASPSWT